MANKRAKTLDDKQFDKLWKHVQRTATLPERDHLILALSFKAGLRVGEIQKINLSAMLDAEGKIANHVRVFSNVGKRHRERCVPMHPLVRSSLAAFMKAFPNAECVAISSQPFRWLVKNGGTVPKDSTFKRMSLTAITNYYWDLVNSAGFEGASSHSGRRTFGTKMARMAGKQGCSIRDVQIQMGHARLESTEGYIDSSENVEKLIYAI